jgi:hypothetical protein
MFKISLGDLWRGAVVAVLGPVVVAVISVVGAVINAPGFDVFSVDYMLLLRDLTNTLIVVGFGSGSGYILKNLLTDKDQNFLGLKTKS